MKLKAILELFHTDLDATYGKNEVQSFFSLLMEHHLDLKPIALVLNPELTICDENYTVFNDALNRLKQEEPIQYIIGKTEFFGLPFKVNPHTLIPRPETEELVDWIIKQPAIYNQQRNLLDIGTGTGCIAISIAKQLLKTKIFALDVSEEALKIAKQNAKQNDVNIHFLKVDILNKAHWNLEFKDLEFDIMVSNPPYVRELEKLKMKDNVLKHEPELALFVDDNDPLIFYKTICEFAQQHLKSGGMLFFEINQYLGDEMLQLLKTYLFKNIELKKDMFGNDRMIKAVKG
ncbi:MAG: peptide chain release factor N(5)-glutamine methyltransferase [Gelidibacter sp.]